MVSRTGPVEDGVGVRGQLGDLPGIGFRYDADAVARYTLTDA